MKTATYQQGFTLIEVMVALAIIAIALTAILSTSASQTNNASYLKQKTLAHWVALNEITELRIKKIFPDLGDKKGSTDMANHTWYWIRTTKATEDKDSRQVKLTVYANRDYTRNLTHLIAYVSR